MKEKFLDYFLGKIGPYINIRTMLKTIFSYLLAVLIYFKNTQKSNSFDEMPFDELLNIKTLILVGFLFVVIGFVFYYVLSMVVRFVSALISDSLILMIKGLVKNPSFYKSVTMITKKIALFYMRVNTPNPEDAKELEDLSFHSKKVEDSISDLLITLQVTLIYWFYLSDEFKTVFDFDTYIKIMLVVVNIYFEYLVINYFFLYAHGISLKKMIYRIFQ